MKFDPAMEDALSEPTQFEAEAAAMREALEGLLRAVRHWSGPAPKKVVEAGLAAETALATDTGKALLEWKRSALTALDEWHQARDIIGGAKLGDGPKEWAARVLGRLRKAEAERDELAGRFKSWRMMEATRERDEAKALLREVEWSGWLLWEDDAPDPCCPVCRAIELDRQGHAPDCRLDALVNR